MFDIKYDKLRKCMQMRHMTLRNLEEISGVSRAHISRIYNNKTQPTLFTILLLADALHVAPDELYEKVEM